MGHGKVSQGRLAKQEVALLAAQLLLQPRHKGRPLLLRLEILHRVGALEPGEPIVFVGTASAHREAAFEACNFVMDYLKTRAPFWKKEHGSTGASWVEGRASDQQAAQRWQDETPS